MRKPLAPWLRDLDRYVSSGGTVRGFSPHADALVTDEAVTIHMDMPGVRREQLEIELENDVLTVRGDGRFPIPARTATAPSGPSSAASGGSSACCASRGASTPGRSRPRWSMGPDTAHPQARAVQATSDRNQRGAAHARRQHGLSTAAVVTCPNCGATALPPAAEAFPDAPSATTCFPGLWPPTPRPSIPRSRSRSRCWSISGAPWCGPCKWVEPAVEDVAKPKAGAVQGGQAQHRRGTRDRRPVRRAEHSRSARAS
jgi:Hsp20/alpha crystallin family